MKYLNTKMIQRFTSNLSNLLFDVHLSRYEVEITISDLKSWACTSLPYWYKERETFKKQYVWLASLQKDVKISNVLEHSTLQKMEVVVARLINTTQSDKARVVKKYIKCRRNKYLNSIEEFKKKIAKLVELQQAIRKQKSISDRGRL